MKSSPEYREKKSYEKGIYSTPTNGQVVIFAARLLAGIAIRQARKRAFPDVWYVGYRRIPPDRATVPEVASGRPIASGHATIRSHRFRRLVSPPGHYYADPFVVHHHGRYHVFVEDYDWSRAKGVISTTTLGRSDPPQTPSHVLERPYHLSYPCVFRSHGDWYMVPETREQRTIELFKAVEFPSRWTLQRVLFTDVDAVDATILEHHGRFWLFVNIAVPGAPIADELCLFFTDSLSDDWRPHAMNPIVSDVRRARPAGRVIARNGELIRPSQDCSRRYGGAVVFNRITRLTPSEYAESPVGRLDPVWMRGDVATHTFNTDGEYEVVDRERPTIS